MFLSQQKKAPYFTQNRQIRQAKSERSRTDRYAGSQANHLGALFRDRFVRLRKNLRLPPKPISHGRHFWDVERAHNPLPRLPNRTYGVVRKRVIIIISATATDHREQGCTGVMNSCTFSVLFAGVQSPWCWR